MKATTEAAMIGRLSAFSGFVCLFSIAVGLSALLGWMLHIEALKTWAVGPSTVKVNTAICFILIGVSLALLRKGNRVPIAWGRKLTARAAAALALLLALLSGAEYVFDFSVGIDQWWSTVPAGEKIGRAGPQLMSPITSLNFLLLGLAIIMLDWRPRRWRAPAPVLSLLAAGASAFGVLKRPSHAADERPSRDGRACPFDPEVSYPISRTPGDCPAPRNSRLRS